MQGYNFKLQKLLDIRLNTEEKCKMEFKKVQNEKNAVENKLNMLKADYDKYKNVHNGNSTVHRKIKQNYLNALNYGINETEDALKSKIQELDSKRDELKQKQVDRKIVEILKEKKYQAFVKEQNLIEQKANDEFALYGFIRKNRERR